MDPLSSVLRELRLDGTYFYPVETLGPWTIQAMPASYLRPHVLPGAQHLISYHVLLEGRCFGGVLGEELVELAAGDVIVFPHGDPHVMASARERRIGTPVAQAIPPRFPERKVIGEGGERTSMFLCGFLGCDLRPFNPLLASLPRRLHVREMPAIWVEGLARQIAEGVSANRPGAAGVLTRMAELMFIEVVRRYLEDLPQGELGWLGGLRDETVGRALALIHDRPAHPWSLAELASACGSSRTRLTERFTTLVGQPPMQYLTRWRMQVASSKLQEGGGKVAAVAQAVGYESEAAFNRAFKKVTGVTPAAWRQGKREAPPTGD